MCGFHVVISLNWTTCPQLGLIGVCVYIYGKVCSQEHMLERHNDIGWTMCKTITLLYLVVALLGGSVRVIHFDLL